MKYVLSQTLFTGFVLAVYFAVEMLRKRDMKYKENKMFVYVCIFSAIWSFGFCGVILQTNPASAYLWRGIGMIGTFGFLIAAQFLICYLSGIKKVYCWLANGFSLLGIIIYFFVIQKEQVVYELSEIGMTYSFHQGLWNNLYILYTIFVAFNQLMIILYMLKKAKAQRMKVLAKKLVVVVGVMVLGMLLDTIFPLFGQPAIPGSTIGQFAGLAVMYHSISFVNHSRITVDNMSEFIYYSLNVPVLVYDRKGKLEIMNDTASEFLRVARDEMEFVTIDRIFTITPEEAFQFEENAQSIDVECWRNKRYCNLTVNKIYDAYQDKIGYIIIVTDLSERMKSMKQLEEAMNEADYANKAKSIFLANMSHEIRTPMNAIIGFSELLLKMNISNEVRSHVQDIKWSSHNLLAIINDVLDISKIESGKMELLPDNYFVAPLLNDVVSIIEPQARKKGLEFEIHVDNSIPKELYGDKVRIRGILINLLNNAVKYTSEGYIKFEVYPVIRYDSKVKLGFRVTDTGSGIKEENLSTLFDNFARLDQKVHFGIEGSGLGLAISKGYIALMGGEIKVSSRYGEGSVFTVEIEQRIIDSDSMNVEDIRVREALEDGKISDFKIRNICVLVVDDNPINLKVAQGILRTYELEVDVASNGSDAIALCEKKKYDIVFLDQMMPHLDGIDTMLRIRRLNDHYALGGDGKIIVLTANAIKGTRETLMNQGFDEYLGKPLNIDRLEALLCRYIPEENIQFEATNGSQETAVQNDSSKQEELTYIKEVLTGVDVDLGISHCGGVVEDYLKVLEITFKYGEKQLNELKKLWTEKDYKGYTIKVHALKSTSLNIGAKEVSEEAKKQETAGKVADYDYIEENIEKLTTDYLDILQKIKEVLIHYELISVENTMDRSMDSSMVSEEKPKLDERMVLHMFRNIETYIDNYDFAKVFDILEETKKYQLPQKYEEVLPKIESLMDDLSVDAVKDLLKEVSAD